MAQQPLEELTLEELQQRKNKLRTILRMFVIIYVVLIIAMLVIMYLDMWVGPKFTIIIYIAVALAIVPSFLANAKKIDAEIARREGS